MSTTSRTPSENGTTEMQLRFMRLPEALAPLVERFGDPFVQIQRSMSVFTWFTASRTQLFTTNDAGELRVIDLNPPDDSRGLSERANEADDHDRGVILARAADEDGLDRCVVDIEALDRSLREIGRTPTAVIAACGDPGRYERLDIQEARYVAKENGLAWVAVNEFEASSEHLDVASGVFKWDENEELVRVLDADEEIFTLLDGALVKEDIADLWSDRPVEWEPATGI